MNQVMIFREESRRLNRNLGRISSTDCCCGVTEAQCFALVEIGRYRGISVKELAERVRLDKSGISRTVEELVQKGLVERKPSEQDRRYVELTLTDKGTERFQMIETGMNRKFQRILEQIPENRREAVIEVLRLYNEACETGTNKEMGE